MFCGALSISGFAQDVTRSTANYNISPFNDARLQYMNTDAMTATRNNLSKKFPGWSILTDKRSGYLTDMYGAAMTIQGNTIADKSVKCINTMLSGAGIKAAEWTELKQNKSTKAQFAEYGQYINNKHVVFAKLRFRYTNDDKLSRINARYYGNKTIGNAPSMDVASVLASAVFTKDIKNAQLKEVKADKDWVWFPVPVKYGYELHPAWHIKASVRVDGAAPVELDGYVDGADGKVLYRSNGVKDAFEVTVKGSVNKTDLVSPATIEPLRNLEMFVPAAGTYNTNSLGSVAIGSITTANTNIRLKGLWSSVVDVNSFVTPAFNVSLTGTGNVYTFPNTTPSGDPHVNAYYHVNVIHDFMKTYFTTYTTLDFPMTTNVEDMSGTCNAFYNPGNNTINFFADGGGCNTMAKAGDVVYHEYGHAINDNFYNDFGTFGGMMNGAMNEAYADIWGLSVTKKPFNGKGVFQGVNGGGLIRRYDKQPRVYPDDIIAEVHADGEIIAGAWWDLGTNFGSIPDMTQLFTETFFDLCDAPDGSEGTLYHDILVSALMNDDNDANISNGTPRFHQIVNAFARHGIFLSGDIFIVHQEAKHTKASQSTDISTDITMLDPTAFKGAMLYYRKRGNTSWDSLTMANTTGSTYKATIPAQPMGAIVDYYIEGRTYFSQVNGILPVGYNLRHLATNTLTLPFQYATGIVAKDSVSFEKTLTGWAIGNVPGDNATMGGWIQAIPVPSFADFNTSMSIISQPGNDHTSGSGNCLVTGNATSASDAPGTNDIDDGKTTVLSAVYDLSSYQNPMIEYYRWFSGSRSAGGQCSTDPFVVMIGNNGTGNWVYIDSTYKSDFSWRRRIVAVKDYLTTLNNVQLKFVAADNQRDTIRNNGQDIVEAAIDDFFIYDQKPVGVENTVAMKAYVYPNPADDKVVITYPSATKGTYVLMDVSGKVAAKASLNTDNAATIIDTKQLTPGTYTLQVQTENSLQSIKLVLHHDK